MSNEIAPHRLIIAESIEGVTFPVHVQPRASRTGITGILGGELKVRLTSPPVDDAANRQLEELIAKTLGIAKSDVSVVAGAKSRHKRVLVRGANQKTVASAINEEA